MTNRDKISADSTLYDKNNLNFSQWLSNMKLIPGRDEEFSETFDSNSLYINVVTFKQISKFRAKRRTIFFIFEILHLKIEDK